MLDKLSIILLCVVIMAYLFMFIRAIVFKFVKGYKYFSIVTIADKICAPLLLSLFSVNVIGIIQGEINYSFSILIIGIIGYSCFNRVLCFEDDKTAIVCGRMLNKAGTSIFNKGTNNIVVLKSERCVVSVWTSAKGKEKLYDRFGS